MPLSRVLQPAIQDADEGFPVPCALGLCVRPEPPVKPGLSAARNKVANNGWDALGHLPKKPHQLRYGGWIVAGIIIERAVRATCNCELQRDPRETLVRTSTPRAQSEETWTTQASAP